LKVRSRLNFRKAYEYRDACFVVFSLTIAACPFRASCTAGLVAGLIASFAYISGALLDLSANRRLPKRILAEFGACGPDPGRDVCRCPFRALRRDFPACRNRGLSGSDARPLGHRSVSEEVAHRGGASAGRASKPGYRDLRRNPSREPGASRLWRLRLTRAGDWPIV
jgi:hypothetical protein